jgi:D-alanyl-D-alanine carboxypeptidase/D-alanyl-D-alanine-endopeptidase (penicillin-binding protein 4)
VTRPGLAWITVGLALVGLLAPATRPVGSAVPGAPATAHGPDSLPAWLEAIVDDGLGRAHWGVAVYDLEASRWVVLHNADRWFVPASNLKLVVSATALERLGPDYAFRTSLYGTGEIEDGELRGDLVLYGRGDPNLSGRHAPGILSIFEHLADSLVARGVERVRGDLIADESFFDDDRTRGDWAAYDLLWWYAAPVGALGFNDNSIDVHVRPGTRVGDPPVLSCEPVSAFYSLENRARTGPAGSARTFDLTRDPGTNRIVAYGSLPLDAEPRIEYFAVVDPARWAGTVFREVLEARGVEVEGETRTISAPALSPVARGDTLPLATYVSVPLSMVVESINGRSQNWHAEQVLKTLGRELRGEGSWKAGLAVERETLDRLGVDTLDFELRDGSGLASTNLATPRGLATLLARAAGRPWGRVFAASLPVAGRTGSLRRRYLGTAAEDRVRAKTGFIENVYALSGYMTTTRGREYAFSVIVNGTGAGIEEEAQEAIDRLVIELVEGRAP